tara:strand:+ start:5844 stop:6029 length:186 start_codon:yes stop_codon:yes gene_type:complete
MEYYPPRILTETWLFLACSTEAESKVSKVRAMNNIIKFFGNIEVAQMYLETFASDSNSKVA